MSDPVLVVRRSSERTLANGHPWIFSGAVDKAPAVDPGSLVQVHDNRGRFLGRGYYNPRSMIRVRLLCHDPLRPIDATYFHETLTRAYQLRCSTPGLQTTNAYRLVHGESDGLPGLIVDRYGDFLVVQFHTLGMECRRQEIIDALVAITKPQGIYERSDVGTRRTEGLEDRPTGTVYGEAPPPFIKINENGITLFVDVYHGQKTGLFLDQRDNRILLHTYAEATSILNCFAYTSGFSAHALQGGATSTLDVDIAPSVLPAARQTLAANTPTGTPARYLITDLFPFLEQAAERGPRFDTVILDPPALLRQRSNHKRAMGVYTKLNRNALKLVRDGGLFISSSCSARISQEDFFQVLRRAAIGAGVQMRQLHYTLQPPDHPVDLAFPEGRYLKCVFARVYR